MLKKKIRFHSLIFGLLLNVIATKAQMHMPAPSCYYSWFYLYVKILRTHIISICNGNGKWLCADDWHYTINKFYPRTYLLQ